MWRACRDESHASRAEKNYIVCSPHNVCSPMGAVTCVHLEAAMANLGTLEYHALEVDWWADLLSHDEPIIEEGHIEVPEEPGLGIELDEDVARDQHLDPGTMFG